TVIRDTTTSFGRFNRVRSEAAKTANASIGIYRRCSKAGSALGRNVDVGASRTKKARIDNPVIRHCLERASHNPHPIAARTPIMRTIVNMFTVFIQGKSYSRDWGNGYTSNLK